MATFIKLALEIIFLFAFSSHSFVITSPVQGKRTSVTGRRIELMVSRPLTSEDTANTAEISAQGSIRRDFLTKFSMGLVATSNLLFSSHPQLARADVSDGNALPQGAAQFSRVIRLKNDLQAVRKRVAENGNELDKKEWESIGSFLRMAYATGEDMKAVAAGIFNPENKKRALDDVDQLRKYAQAGDVSVSKKDPKGFVAVADKMVEKVDDFLESLSDVPDEL